jgi:serine/threonine protein kinase
LILNSNGFEWSGSGSGAGGPGLLPRTIAREIKLIYPCIGKGRFGEVYKGMWRDNLIAVKTFNSADEKSWENECNIYSTSGFRHENILGFIASDNIDRGTYTELMIITEYHKNGSLYDYLNQVTLKQTAAQTLRMALSIVNGLDHLHTAIESCTGKPALAHCDLKSKNILVKKDFSCCISDLGLALSGDKNRHVTQNPATIRTGTKRYMAPEILAKTINFKSLLQFQKAEMYSLSLIFWELLRRTMFELFESNSDSDKKHKVIYSYDYKLPYHEYIQSDPDELQMKQLVCDQKIRPEVNNLWREVPILNELTQLTEELWVENADGRLNALRLKKSLNQIERKYLGCIEK